MLDTNDGGALEGRRLALGHDGRDRVSVIFDLAGGDHGAIGESRPEAGHGPGQVVRGEDPNYTFDVFGGRAVYGTDPGVATVELNQREVQDIFDGDVGGEPLRPGHPIDPAHSPG
jgi:hypothetical protein